MADPHQAPSWAADRVVRLGQTRERRHGGDVIGIRRVAQAEQDGDEEDDCDGAPSEIPAIQSSSPNM